MPNRNNLPSRQQDHGLSRMFDRYARDFFAPMLEDFDLDRSLSSSDPQNFIPRIEVKDTEHGYEVCAELPGIKPENIDLSLEDNSLIIQGEKRQERKDEEKGRFRSEFSYGSFYRTIPLRQDVDNENINANYEDGILRVQLSKKKDGTEKSRKILINKNTPNH